jgi:hypothetical protein
LLKHLRHAVFDRSGIGAVVGGADRDGGGAISGYCSIPIVEIAKAPADITTMAMTQAKIGRWAKKRESMGAYFVPCAGAVIVVPGVLSPSLWPSLL